MCNYIKVVISGPCKPDSREPYMWQNSGKGIFLQLLKQFRGVELHLTYCKWKNRRCGSLAPPWGQPHMVGGPFEFPLRCLGIFLSTNWSKILVCF